MRNALLLWPIAFVLAALVGCSMNVRHASMGANRWLVTVEGSQGHSHAEMMHAANQRAMELCGPEGYDIVTAGSGTQVSGVATGEGGGTVSSKGSVSITVECATSQRGPGPY